MAETSALKVHKAAVLGAGVMGAQIAAHLTNCGIQTVLFDLPATGGDLNGIVDAAKKQLTRLKPAPLAANDLLSLIEAANYEQNLSLLEDCDLVIEAIAERLDWKVALYQQISPHLSARAMIASNTSGLSISKLMAVLPEQLHERFCGVHFFNPPRYMHLVELIPTASTDPALVDSLESFLVSALGKGVVRAKDTPNFIANRVGVFAILAILHHAASLDIPYEVVDALTGPRLGRPKSATYRTLDVVGLDTMAHVIQTLTDNLPDDPWAACYQAPAVLTQLIEAGALGQKTKAGFYRKQGKVIQVFDPQSGNYRDADGVASPAVLAILKERDPALKLAALRESSEPQAQFLWRSFRDIFHYCAFHLDSIAETVRDVDLAIRFGFGWQHGPFETWQAAGWEVVMACLNESIAAGETLADVPLPAWVAERGDAGVYTAQGAFSVNSNRFEPRSTLSVYARQLFPKSLPGEAFDEGETVFETPAVRLWHQHDGVAILSFKTKMNTASNAVLDGLLQAAEVAERDFKALVLWQRHGDHFSAGANLQEFIEGCQQGDFVLLDKAVEKFQRAAMAMRYCSVPTVAAIKGYTFGGGCEIVLHCDRRVAALETYIGLVEAGVGLIPAGGGSKEFARRAALASRDDLMLEKNFAFYYEKIAKAMVASSGLEARQHGFLIGGDVVLPNADELLFVAKQQALALAGSAYQPPAKRPIKVLGRQGIANCQMLLTNMLEGGFISEHDKLIAEGVAEVMCGGDIDSGSEVDEAWLLALERKVFVALTQTEATQARIEFMLKKGKPLRN